MFDSNYKDKITEAAKKVLHPNQKALDVDKDGDIEADDLKDLRDKKDEAKDESDPCWKGYKQLGMKDKDGKKVPNCVPESTELTDEQIDEAISGYAFSPASPLSPSSPLWVGRHLSVPPQTGVSYTVSTGDIKIFLVALAAMGGIAIAAGAAAIGSSLLTKYKEIAKKRLAPETDDLVRIMSQIKTIESRIPRLKDQEKIAQYTKELEEAKQLFKEFTERLKLKGNGVLESTEIEVTERVTGGYSKSYSNPYYAEQKAKMRKLDAARKEREKAAKEAAAKSTVKEGSMEPETTRDKKDIKLPPPVKGGKLTGTIPAGFKKPKDTGFYGMNSKSIKDVMGEMTDTQMDKKEKLIKALKKSKADFVNRYGKDAESVMYATATKMAMKEENTQVEGVTEASETFFTTFSAAVQYAYDAAEKKGYVVDEDDWHNKVSTGPKKPSVGKTNSYNIALMKNGKESRQRLHIQVYGMEGGKYELNFYIS